MGWEDLRPWGIKKRWILLALLLIMGVSRSPSTTTPSVSNAIKIEHGRLSSEYPGLDGKPFNVSMKSGAFESSRANDIEELAKDWIFFRKRIVDRTAAGDSAGAQQARNDFQKVNKWLEQYDENDVAYMIGRVENR